MTPFQEEVVNNVFLLVVMLVYHFAVTLSQDNVAPSQDKIVASSKDTVAPFQGVVVAIDSAFKSGFFNIDITIVTSVADEVTILQVSTMGRTKTLVAKTNDVSMIYNDQNMKEKFLQLVRSHDLIRNDNPSYHLVYDNDFNKFLAE